MTKKRLIELGKLHDVLYARACKVFEENNPCKINRNGCLGCRYNLVTKRERCCVECKYLGPKGCTVEALYCKTWVCYHVELTDEQSKELAEIQRIAKENHLLVFRGSKLDALKYAIPSFNETVLKWIKLICEPVVVKA